MIFVASTLIVLIIAFLTRKSIVEFKNKEKEIKKILDEEFTRCCYNCELKDKFNIPYDSFKIYCKDGSIHEKWNYCCNMHEYDNDIKDRATNIYLLRNKNKLKRVD